MKIKKKWVSDNNPSRIINGPLSGPDSFKEKAKEYLTMNHILDGTAQEQGIYFQVDHVLVGNIMNDTWNRALNRLEDRLKILRSKVQIATKLHGKD